jgi:hypothetical protein
VVLVRPVIARAASRTQRPACSARPSVVSEIAALIERTELVRDWLECAARCECPDLDQCSLFDEPALPPR